MYRLTVPILLCFFLLLILALVIGPALLLTPQVVKIADVSGPVEVRSGGRGGWRRLSAGAMVKKGDEVRTRRGGQTRLLWQDGTCLLLEPDGQITVQVCDVSKLRQRATSVLLLDMGRVWVRVRTLPSTEPGSGLTIKTPNLVASVQGTTFSVATDGTTSTVSVHDGRVQVTAGERRLAVQAGESAQVAADAPPRTGAMSPAERTAWRAQTVVLQPYLRLVLPFETQVIHRRMARVRGITDAGCNVTVNDQPVTVADDGGFATRVPLTPGRNVITVVSLSPEGMSQQLTRTVMCRPELSGEK